MLYSGILNFYYAIAIKSQKLANLSLFAVILPPVLSESTMIWKDVLLAHSLFLALSIMVLAHMRNKKLSLITELFILGLLFLSISFKFQAKFMAWPLLILFVYLRYKKLNYKTVLIGLSLHMLLVYACIFLQSSIARHDNSQKMRQFFDLGAIVHFSKDESLLPEHITNKPYFSLNDLHALYTPKAVDPYI